VNGAPAPLMAVSQVAASRYSAAAGAASTGPALG
jgi:hypothetical protein